MRLYDTHLHLLYPENFTYPWTEGLPALAKPFRLEDYAAEVSKGPADVTIVGAAFMEVDVPEAQQEEEARFFAANIGEGNPPLTAVIASCRPESKGFAEQVERLAADKRVRGLRRILHTSDNTLSQSELFVSNLNRLAPLGLSFDLCLRSDQLHLGMALADQCPGVQFILDHCGGPAIAKQALDPWRDDLRELAKRPNVACKISGITAHADASVPLTPQLRPFVEHTVSVFGWGRVVWGSDWPVCNLTFGLAGWLAATRDLFAGASESERERLGTENARRIYRLS